MKREQSPYRQVNRPTREAVRTLIVEILDLPTEKAGDTTELASLVHNSFLLVELIIELQETFDVRFGQAEMQAVRSIGQLIDLFVQEPADRRIPSATEATG